ncbi:hypothetical protein Emag_003298 [Eimeria magna]
MCDAPAAAAAAAAETLHFSGSAEGHESCLELGGVLLQHLALLLYATSASLLSLLLPPVVSCKNAPSFMIAAAAACLLLLLLLLPLVVVSRLRSLILSQGLFLRSRCFSKQLQFLLLHAARLGLTRRLAEVQGSPRALCDVPLLAESFNLLLCPSWLLSLILLVSPSVSPGSSVSCTAAAHRLLVCPFTASKAKAASLESESLLNATSRHVLRQSPFFATPDLKETIGWLMQAGPPDRRYTLLLQRAAAAAAAPAAPAAPASAAAAKDAGRQAAATADTAAAAAAAAACTLGPEDLENSLQRVKNKEGPLLLGRAAVRARAKAKAEAAAATAAATAATAAAVAAAAVSGESAARRRHRHRQRILEEEGWDLLHRRVGAMGELKRWL